MVKRTRKSDAGCWDNWCTRWMKRSWASSVFSVFKIVAASMMLVHYYDDDNSEDSKRLYFRVDGIDYADGVGNMESSLAVIYYIALGFAVFELVLPFISKWLLDPCTSDDDQEKEEFSKRYHLGFQICADVSAVLGLALMTGSDEKMGFFFHGLVSLNACCITLTTSLFKRNYHAFFRTRGMKCHDYLEAISYWLSVAFVQLIAIVPHIMFFFNIRYKDESGGDEPRIYEDIAVGFSMAGILLRNLSRMLLDMNTEPYERLSEERASEGDRNKMKLINVIEGVSVVALMITMSVYGFGAADEDAPKYGLVSWFVENVSYINRSLNVGQYLFPFVCFPYMFFGLVLLVDSLVDGKTDRFTDRKNYHEDSRLFMLSLVNGVCGVILLMVTGAHDIQELVSAGVVLMSACIFWHTDVADGDGMVASLLVFFSVVFFWVDVIAKLQYTELRKDAHHLAVYASLFWFLMMITYTVISPKLKNVRGKKKGRTSNQSEAKTILSDATKVSISQFMFVLSVTGLALANTLHTRTEVDEFI